MGSPKRLAEAVTSARWDTPRGRYSTLAPSRRATPRPGRRGAQSVVRSRLLVDTRTGIHPTSQAREAIARLLRLKPAPLRRPTFRRLWLGMTTSYSGDRLQQLAQAWLVAMISGSALQVGLISIANSIPPAPSPARRCHRRAGRSKTAAHRRPTGRRGLGRHCRRPSTHRPRRPLAHLCLGLPRRVDRARLPPSLQGRPHRCGPARGSSLGGRDKLDD